MASGIVQTDDEISRRCRCQSLADHRRRGQQITETDDTEIIHQRRPQHGRCHNCRSDARDNLHFHTICFPCRKEFQYKPCHAVDTRISAAYQCHALSLSGPFDGLHAALPLGAHGRLHIFLLREQIPHQGNVGRIADDHIRFFHSRPGFFTHILLSAGAQPYHIKFSHTASLFL